MIHHSGDRLRQRARELRLRPVDLARELDESSQNINAWLKRGVPHSKIEVAARLLDCTEEWLRTGEGDSTLQNKISQDSNHYQVQARIPIIGNAQAGPNGYWDDLGQLEHGDGFVQVHSTDPNAYALRVKGDSMAPAIKNNWIVVIEPNSAVHQGEYVLVCTTDGRCMIKELRYTHDDEYTLGSVNDNHPAMTLPKADVIRIQAVTNIVSPSKRQV